uniref:ras-related protein Rab-33B n=1 Tax=Myxine glutinosa TaxID=7769 RepID=UPI00358DE7C8
MDSPSSSLESSMQYTDNSLINSQTIRIFKIIVIGEKNVGKTCLTFRFCGGGFPERTEATIGVDFRERSVEIEGERIKLQLWDTAGQERFRRSMIPHYYRNVHAVVFVYDVTRRDSFIGLPLWLEECQHHIATQDIPRILVGNKCDLRDKIEVTTQEAQQFADAHGMPLFETSAKALTDSGDHIEAIFLTLAHKLYGHRSMTVPTLSHQQAHTTILLKDESPSDEHTCYC